jgi:hypothetical protein
MRRFRLMAGWVKEGAFMLVRNVEISSWLESPL